MCLLSSCSWTWREETNCLFSSRDRWYYFWSYFYDSSLSWSISSVFCNSLLTWSTFLSFWWIIAVNSSTLCWNSIYFRPKFRPFSLKVSVWILLYSNYSFNLRLLSCSSSKLALVLMKWSVNSSTFFFKLSFSRRFRKRSSYNFWCLMVSSWWTPWI